MRRLSIKEVAAIKKLLNQRGLSWVAEHIVPKCHAVGFCLEEKTCSMIKFLIPNYDEKFHHEMKQDLENKFQENLKNLAEGKEDGYSRYLRLLDNFLYVEIYSIGNNAELLKALFEFGKKERSLEGSRFYHNTGEIADVFLHYKYFPDDPATRNVARDFISGLLKREEKAIKKGEFKKYALDYVAHFVKMGILDEENDADLIDAVTAAD